MAHADEKKQAEDVPPTEMIYLTYDGNFELECDAKLVGLQEQENGNVMELSLDRTVMHAQGGGQPTDIGTITWRQQDGDDKELVVSVDKVILNRETGVASHRGKLVDKANGEEAMNNHEMVCQPVIGSPVHVSVDANTRRVLSECHTAGHVVDSAMAKCGKLMKPSKAYHFLEGPYVEYKGDIPAEERPKVLAELKVAFQELVDADIATKIETMPQEQAHEVCNRIADNFDMKDFGGTEEGGADIRVVTVAGFPCPCGGTHVKSTGDLKERGWGVTGIKCKKGVVRVKYGQGT